MSKNLNDAFSENAWSVSAIMFDMDDLIDDEGRPISERRADAVTRVGVEMEMRLCPFGGIRDGKWMNVSALTQINRYYQDAISELAAFRHHPKGEHFTWDDVLACIVELFAGPATYLLQQRKPEAVVPARVAVRHKLAAGMFGVMLTLHERMTLGADAPPVNADSFMDLIDETGALVGASEACAGSPKMIRKVSEALLELNPDSPLELDPLRLDIGRCLALQVQLGIFWRLYDRVHLWELVQGKFREHLAPRNNFLERKISTAANNLNSPGRPPRPNCDMLPDMLDTQVRHQFVEAINDNSDPKLLELDCQVAENYLTEQAGAIVYNGPFKPFADSVANYLHTYRLFEAELSRMELALRKLLDYSLDTPIRLGPAAFPSPQALHWYELVLGRKLGSDGHLTGAKIKFTKLTG